MYVSKNDPLPNLCHINNLNITHTLLTHYLYTTRAQLVHNSCTTIAQLVHNSRTTHTLLTQFTYYLCTTHNKRVDSYQHSPSIVIEDSLSTSWGNITNSFPYLLYLIAIKKKKKKYSIQIHFAYFWDPTAANAIILFSHPPIVKLIPIQENKIQKEKTKDNTKYFVK
jgi:hypothetical protein